ncbi:MAG TPA: SRPBCC domain-containing protein [Polyangiaceae bacterium]|jgi:uncharacterized protein YndB with AHSA1/START domain
MSTAKSPARAIADVSTGLILATVEIAAPPERVFRALTSEELVKWWGSDDLYRTTAWHSDVRVGGKWRADGKGNDGAPFFVEGEYLEVEAPKKVSFTWKPQWENGRESKVTYLLEAIDTGTRVVLRHEGFGDRADSCRSHANGWERVLGWLTAFVTPAAPAAEAKYFALKLIAPRKTFPFDMTEDERKMMAAHAAYWAEHMRAGTSLLYGPVADPAGAYGLGVVRVKDEKELEALIAGDPAIRGEKGLRYEVAPMLRAVVKG